MHKIGSQLNMKKEHDKLKLMDNWQSEHSKLVQIEGLDSTHWSWIQMNNARFQLIRVGFFHHIDLSGSFQTCNDEFIFVF